MATTRTIIVPPKNSNSITEILKFIQHLCCKCACYLTLAPKALLHALIQHSRVYYGRYAANQTYTRVHNGNLDDT